MKNILVLITILFFTCKTGISQSIIPDSSFGNNGIATKKGAQFFGAALQRNGKMVVTGELYSTFYAARYNSNGTFDSTFSQNGELKSDLYPPV